MDPILERLDRMEDRLDARLSRIEDKLTAKDAELEQRVRALEDKLSKQAGATAVIAAIAGFASACLVALGSWLLGKL